MYADVAVCLPLSRTFVYKVGEPVEVGCRVVVPFRKRDMEGFVVGLRNDAVDDIEIHPITNIIDQSPLLRPEIFRLCRWISEYYVSPLGEVLKGALPPGISQKHLDKPAGAVGEAQARQRAASKGEAQARQRAASKGVALAPGRPPLQLTSDQTTAFEAIRNGHGFQTLLLHGVTGSGKTEVYMRAAEHFVAAGKSSLILIPEIALTPQLTDRFSQRFPRRIAILHSSLSKRQRIDEWLRIYRGETPIVMGTRSAVFAPLERLGLIVVDEEHESSYKQEESPRYNGRDVAVVRGRMESALVVLGSATPSMESFRNAESGKYRHLSLTTRVEDRALPDVEIVNMREEYAAEGKQV